MQPVGAQPGEAQVADLPWLAKPERLAVALERQWLEATSLLPDNLPELPALLTDGRSRS